MFATPSTTLNPAFLSGFLGELCLTFIANGNECGSWSFRFCVQLLNALMFNPALPILSTSPSLMETGISAYLIDSSDTGSNFCMDIKQKIPPKWYFDKSYKLI